MKKELLVLVIVLFLALVLISGFNGCEIPGTGGVSQTGLDFNLIDEIGTLTAGKTLEQDDTFYVATRIENYDERDRSGEICVRDNIADSYGGVPSECRFFSVKGAETLEKETRPGKADIYFPEGAEYAYHGLPEMLRPYEGLLFVSLRYRQSSQITATVTTPGLEQPSLAQDPAPITVTVYKTVRRRQDAYKVDLQIDLKKSKGNISSPDFAEPDKIYFRAEMPPTDLKCFIKEEPILGLIDFENEKLIKCSAFVYEETEQSFPLIITLDYGVTLEKKFPFNILTKTS